MNIRRFYVIAYDVADNKRRKKIGDLLDNNGIRKNRSVFECFLTDNEFRKISGELRKTTKRGKDIILFYRLCSACMENIQYDSEDRSDRSSVSIV